MKDKNISRRAFVGDLSKAALAATIVPRHVLGGAGFVAPSDMVNIAVVGMGGKGNSDAYALVEGGQRVTVVADIDFNLVAKTTADRVKNNDGTPNPVGVELQKQFMNATRYADYREMLDKEQKNIDGVLVATPDHTHAIVGNAAMELGLPVYVQKPLTHTVKESRVLAETAKRTGVVTQMGNQGHSSDDARRINEWVQAGVIGPVHEVQVWTNRPIWPQGLPRPAHAPPPANIDWGQHDVSRQLAAAMGGNYPVPEGVHWDLFLGPAPVVSYHPIYHPFNWRGWTDWGCGAIGDMGAHLIDHPFWALDLGLPTSIETTSTPYGMDYTTRTEAAYPISTQVHYEFAARGSQPPVRMTWHDGGLMPARPDALPADVPLERGGGVIFIGEKGILMHETYGENPQLYPQSLMEEAARVPEKYKRVTTSHEMNWANAIMGKDEASSPFDYAARLTETMLLGLVALRAGQGKKILYDGDNMRITNVPEANEYLHREYRAGWNL